MVAKKNKGERNIRIAAAEGDEEGRDPVDRLTNLARSYTFAEKHEEALALYTQARSMPTTLAGTRRTLLRSGAQTCLTVGRPQEALAWADELKSVCKSPDTANYMRGMALADLGRYEESLEAFAGCDEMTDDDGVVFPVSSVYLRRATCYSALGNWEAAATEFDKVEINADTPEVVFALAVEAYWRNGRDVSALVDKLDARSINALLAQLKTIPPAAADLALETLVSKPELQSNVLALAISIAPQLACERTMVWSQALRQVGLTEKCPLIAKAWDVNQPATERIRASALASAAFNDDRASGALKFAAPSLEIENFVTSLFEISELSPSLLEPFIVAAANLPERSLAMGKALHDLGATEEGAAVIVAGFEKPGVDSSLASEAAEWLTSVGCTEEASQLRTSVG